MSEVSDGAAVQLPGHSDNVPKTVESLAERLTGSENILRYETTTQKGNEKTVYVANPFDEDGDPVYSVFIPGNLRSHQLTNRSSLINSLKKASVGELLEPEQLGNLESDVNEWYDRIFDLGNPLDGLHVFVATHDDGRKKDLLKFERGEGEQSIREDKGLQPPGSNVEKVYYYAGTVREVLNGEAQIDFQPDLKQTQWHHYPTSLRYMTEESPSKAVREQFGEVNADE